MGCAEDNCSSGSEDNCVLWKNACEFGVDIEDATLQIRDAVDGDFLLFLFAFLDRFLVYTGFSILWLIIIIILIIELYLFMTLNRDFCISFLKQI